MIIRYQSIENGTGTIHYRLTENRELVRVVSSSRLNHPEIMCSGVTNLQFEEDKGVWRIDCKTVVNDRVQAWKRSFTGLAAPLLGKP
jgi:hypothetical protein